MGYSEISMDMIPEDSLLYSNLQQDLKAGMRAKDLVKQILTFSRLAEKERRPIEIGCIAKETLKLLRASLPSTIEIRQNIAVFPQSMTMADPTQIHQVIMNLCANAAHAMREKGGLLEVTLAEANLAETDSNRPAELAPGRYLKFSVSDTGHGMNESIRGQIFDPFFTTKPRGEGTGLGLAVVHGIVKNCGGAIKVRSAPGEGATFNLFFPTIASENEEVQAAPKEVPTGKGWILFVDDEEALAAVAKTMLERLGYNVVAMSDSIGALEAFQGKPDRFDLLITDYTMPHMTGLSLAMEARRIRADLPVILCSGYSDMISGETAADFGIEFFVQKPFDRHLIAQTIKTALEGSRSVE
jgi:CheY-like chemotaxis protein/two-component sensor histidine kinase